MAVRPHWLCIVFAAAALAACSTTADRGAALGLAEAGVTAAVAMSEEAAASRTAFLDDGRRADLLFYLGRAAAPPAAVPTGEIARTSPARAANEETRRRIALVLLQREQAMDALARAYAELGALAAADPGADVRTAVGTFTERANVFIAAVGAVPGVGALPLIGSLGATAAGEGLALVAERRQREEVKRTSADIRSALLAVAAAVEAERDHAAAIRQGTIGTKASLRAALIEAGLADHAATVATVADLSGSAPREDAVERLEGPRGERLRAALDGYQKTEQARDAAVVVAAYETLIAALRALVDEHRKLEADAPVDATLIRLWAARVEEIAGRLRAAGHAGG